MFKVFIMESTETPICEAVVASENEAARYFGFLLEATAGECRKATGSSPVVEQTGDIEVVVRGHKTFILWIEEE